VLIRHADPARDAAGCAAIYAPFVRDTAVSFEESPPDAATMAARIETISRSYPWLVADDGEVAGYTYASQHRVRPGYRWAVDVTVYVAERCRGQGVGRRLYEGLLALLAHQGLRSACAGVTLPNPASVALHRAVGFELVGVYRQIGWKAGAWRDVGWWQCELAPPGPEPPHKPRAPARLEELQREPGAPLWTPYRRETER
jgi:phosphinothricin acetyltransferase